MTLSPPPEQGDAVTFSMPAADLLDVLIESSPEFTEAIGVLVRQSMSTILTRNGELGIPTN